MTSHAALAVVLSLVAAFMYALSNVLEQSEAETVPAEHALRPTLLIRLAQRRRWLLGFASDAGGFATSAGALAVGAVVFVAPLLSMGLLFSLLLGARLEHRRVPAAGWRAAVLLCLGLSVFLYATSPTHGRSTAPGSLWLLAAPCIALAIAVCVALAAGNTGAVRGALLGIAAAIAFATGAVLTKAFVGYFDDGVLAWVPHWEPYAMAVAIPLGFLLVQSAFQAGSLAASVAGIEATEPIVSVILGVVLLKERVEVSGPLEALVIALSCVAVVWAVVVLAHVEEPHAGSADASGAIRVT